MVFIAKRLETRPVSSTVSAFPSLPSSGLKSFSELYCYLLPTAAALHAVQSAGILITQSQRAILRLHRRGETWRGVDRRSVALPRAKFHPICARTIKTENFTEI